MTVRSRVLIQRINEFACQDQDTRVLILSISGQKENVISLMRFFHFWFRKLCSRLVFRSLKLTFCLVSSEHSDINVLRCCNFMLHLHRIISTITINKFAKQSNLSHLFWSVYTGFLAEQNSS